MPIKIVNYTKFKNKDKRVYNLFGYPIPGGVDVSFLVISFIYLILFNLAGYPLSKKIGVPYFNFETGNHTYGFTMIFMPFVVAFVTGKIKIKNYSIYEYVFQAIIYSMKPKNSSLRETGNSVSKRIGYFLEEML